MQQLWSLLLSLLVMMMMEKEVQAAGARLIVGLNPALQRTCLLQSGLQVGSVNRVASLQIGIGGKGQDVYVAASIMSPGKAPLMAQFLGLGAEGDALESLLKERNAGMPLSDVLTVRTRARLRTCVTLVDALKNNEATEIVEPSGTISEEEVEALLLGVRIAFGSKPAKAVAVMGSMPPGCPSGLYSSILSLCCDEKTKVVIDSATDVVAQMACLAQRGSTCILKVNARELCSLAGIANTAKGGEASEATPLALVLSACSSLEGKVTAAISPPPSSTSSSSSSMFVAVTDGPYASHLIPLFSTSLPVIRYSIPPLPRPILNPIGAGDAVASGLLMHLHPSGDDHGSSGSGSAGGESGSDSSSSSSSIKEIRDAFSWGLAVGAASCLSQSNSVFAIEDALAIQATISITEIAKTS